HDGLVHVGEPAVHGDGRAPGVAAIVGREELDARIVLVQERDVDRAAAAARVCVGPDTDLRVELPSDGLAGCRTNEALRTEGCPSVDGAPEQNTGPGAVLTFSRVD